MNIEDELYKIINYIRSKKELGNVMAKNENLDLRKDLDFDSLDLAELTVRVENKFNIDIFTDEAVSNVKDIMKKLKPDE